MSEDSLTVFTKSYCSSAHVREMIYLVRERTIHEKPDRTDSVVVISRPVPNPIRSDPVVIGRVPRIDNSMLV